MHTLVSDALWDHLHPLLPPQPKRRFRFPGRRPLEGCSLSHAPDLPVICGVFTDSCT